MTAYLHKGVALLRRLLPILLLLIAVSSISQQVYWNSIDSVPGYATPTRLMYEQGKGAWVLGKDGLHFVDDKTKKITRYHLDDSGRTVPRLSYMALMGNTVYATSGKALYKLNEAGKWVNIKLIQTPGYSDWHYLSVNGNTLTLGSLALILNVKGDRQEVFRVTSGSRRGLANRNPAMLFCSYDMGSYLLYSSRLYTGIYTHYKNTSYESVISQENPINDYLEPDKGLWLVGTKEVLFFSVKTEKPTTVAHNIRSSETPERLVKEADGKLYLYSSKSVYQLDLQESDAGNTITITPRNDKATIKPALLFKRPLAIKNHNTYYHVDDNGLHYTQDAKTTTLVENKIPASSLTKNNSWMPDGNIYTNVNGELFSYTGKNKPVQIDYVGYGGEAITDGKKVFIVKGSAVYEKAAAGVGKLIVNTKAESSISTQVFPDGNIYMAGNSGVGVFSKGKLDFVAKSAIAKFPISKAVQSIAVSPKRDIYIFLDSMYIYKDKTLTNVPGSKGLYYTHHFDPFGGLYSSGIGEAMYFDGTTGLNMKEIIKTHYNVSSISDIFIGAMTVDYKGRCWLKASFNRETSILILEKGKIIDKLSQDMMPLSNDSDVTFYSKGKELLLLTKTAGLAIYKLK